MILLGEKRTSIHGVVSSRAATQIFELPKRIVSTDWSDSFWDDTNMSLVGMRALRRPISSLHRYGVA